MVMMLPLSTAPTGTVRVTVATPFVVVADEAERVPTEETKFI